MLFKFLLNLLIDLTIYQHNNILDTPIAYISGVGPTKAALLEKDLGIVNYYDALMHFPFRYFDKTKISFIKDLNETQEYVLLFGKLVNISEEGVARKKRLTAQLFDATGTINLVWFQSINYVQKNLEEYQEYYVFGKINLFNNAYSITHPELDRKDQVQNVMGMQPVYSSSSKLASLGINNRSFGKITKAIFQKITPEVLYEFLPQSIISRLGLLPRNSALFQIHFPESEALLQKARYRLKWEELFIMQMQIGKLRLQHTVQAGFVFSKVGQYFNDFYNNHLPFALTGAQKRVVKEIRNDTLSGRQMNRLVQGDVGSGKTMVALLSMLLALDNNFQACLMAPTEILARQHYQSIQTLIAPLGIVCVLLTGSVKGKERNEILKAIHSGTVQIVIGTHAIIEPKVVFKNLGLAVIDEQHKFGVGQRAQIWSKNTLAPHILVMTATPIPRTLAMTLYGDLEISVIDELPPGRQSIQTFHRTEMYRAKIMDFIKQEIHKGRQAYIVYPLIEESEKLDYESLLAGYEQVKSWFPDSQYKIAMAHGKQDPDERKRNMDRFANGDAHILVATTVIEVGVNVPNASVMLIESAERFGLSQLHQLRGRVGRGAEQSYCILLTGTGISKDSFERMRIMTQSADGFYIAEKDLEMRGPGDVYGTQQSGMLKLNIADLVKDAAIIESCRETAKTLIAQDPQLNLPENRPLKSHLQIVMGKEQWNKIS